MKSAVETLSPTRVRLSVEVPFDEVKPALDKAYREISKQINIPGFRKGKVPPPVIDRQVGRDVVVNQAINDTLPDVYMNALRENEIEPLGQPDLDLQQGGDGVDIQFTAEVDVRPEFELPPYNDLEVTVSNAEPTDEDVDAQLEQLRERFGTLVTVERPAADDDTVTIDLKATQQGEPVEGAQITGHSYKVGSGGLVDGIDDALRGMSAGEEKTFVSQLVGGDQAGEDVDIHVKVDAVKEQQLPEVDDEFAQMASEFDTIEELRTDLREKALNSKRLEQAGEARDKVLEQLLEPLEVPLPEGAVSSEVATRKQNLQHEVTEHVGLPWQTYLEQVGQTEEELDAEIDENVRSGMRTEFVLDKLAEAETTMVGQDELTTHLLTRAQRAGADPNEYVQRIVQGGHVPTVMREVRRNKALAQLVENSRVTDEDGRPVELKRLRPDGTIAPEEDELAEGEAVSATEEAAGSGEVAVEQASDTNDTDTNDTETADGSDEKNEK